MNNKKVVIIVLIVALVVIIFNITLRKDKILEQKNDNIAYIYETDEGEVKGTLDDWLSGEYADYVLDEERSSCNKDSDSSGLSWDNERHTVLLTSNQEDKCTLYFHSGSTTLKDYIKGLIENGNEVKSGDGYLYLHDTTLADSAEDGGYRYAGDKPNNYICFGSGSEGYNNGTDTECPLTNKYRIIGLVPVITSEGKEETLVKIIKAEYITAEELVETLRHHTPYFNDFYAGLKRIETDLNDIDGFYWNDDVEDNTWSTSTLYNALNNEITGYLNFLYGTDKTKRQNWQNKIETVKWNVGGWGEIEITAKEMYDGEMTDGGCYENNCIDYPQKQGSGTTVDAKVGLMYAHDYVFASLKDYWTSSYWYDDDSYNNNFFENNWLFNEIGEWTISRFFEESYPVGYPVVLYVNVFISEMGVQDTACGVRPILYLKSNVGIKESDADGSISKPYKIS